MTPRCDASPPTAYRLPPTACCRLLTGDGGMVRLDGKVAVITGAATGIGRATAVLFAREGARVVFGDVNDVEADETLRLIGLAGGDGLFVHCDVRQSDDVRRLVDAAVSTHGRLNIMMNNVGVNFYGKVHETSEEDWLACL